MFRAKKLIDVKKSLKQQEALYKKRTKKVNESLTLTYNWKL
jgi:hypothetical protein